MAKKKLMAFHGNPDLKAQKIIQLEEHRRLDRIIQGEGWELQDDGIFRGCAVGCTLENYKHDAYETELGIPAQIAYLQDIIFENLSDGEYQKFPIQFIKAVPVGADLKLVSYHFAAAVYAMAIDNTAYTAAKKEWYQAARDKLLSLLAAAPLHPNYQQAA